MTIAKPPAAEPDDPVAALIKRGRHRAAISSCAKDYGAPLGRFCMSMLGSQAEAEEVVQETLIAAFRGMSEWRGEGSVRAWLYGIARRLCAKRVAKRVRRDRRLRLVHDAGVEADLPHDIVERTRRAQAVRSAVANLKPSEREVVVLRYQSGLAYREIAAICEIDETAARKRASRALISLRGQFDSEVL